MKVGKVGDLYLAEKGQGSQIIMLEYCPFFGENKVGADAISTSR